MTIRALYILAGLALFNVSAGRADHSPGHDSVARGGVQALDQRVTDLETGLAQEIQNRTAADNTEAAVRAEADDRLEVSIADERGQRITADESLLTEINLEKAARTLEDNAIRSALENIQLTPGPKGDKGDSCSVMQEGDGAKITCDDGNTAIVSNGAPGLKGDKGDPGTSVLVGQQCPRGQVAFGVSGTGLLLCTGAEPGTVGADCGFADPNQIAPIDLNPFGVNEFVLLQNADLSNCALFRTRFITGVILSSNFSGADLSQSSFEAQQSVSASHFDGANFLGADLRNSTFVSSSFQGADLRSVTYGGELGTTFQNCDFLGANLNLGINLETGIVWDNSRCPDGTNSNADDGDGFTCLNNLLP